jgi:hypothetical protein
MTVETQDIVTLDHHGKRRMGIVLQVGIVPGGAAVAIGYGVQHRHGDSVHVAPESQEGRVLRIYKPTYFYPHRTLIISLEAIYATGRKCPKTLFQRLQPFLGRAIMNSYKRLGRMPKSPRVTRRQKLTATLGELIKQKSERTLHIEEEAD